MKHPILILVLLVAVPVRAMDLMLPPVGTWLDSHNVHFHCLNRSIDLGACQDREPTRLMAIDGSAVVVPNQYMGWNTVNPYLGTYLVALLLLDTAVGAYGLANPSCLGVSAGNPFVQNASIYFLSTIGAWVGMWIQADSNGGQWRNYALITDALPKSAMTGWNMASFARNCR